MYDGCMYSNDTIETWREAAVNSNIRPFVLMEFALIYWLNKKKDTCSAMELKQFTQLLNAICSIASKCLNCLTICFFRNTSFAIRRCRGNMYRAQ